MLPLVLCVEHGIDINTIPLEMTVFRTNAHTYAHPGHCTLLLERLGHNGHPVLLSALFHDSNGRSLLSSDIFVQKCSSADRDPNEVRHTRAGPSNPATFVGVLNTDTVFAISIQCRNILQRWAKRARRWPSPEIVKTVVSIGSLVTHVGFKGSENKNVEWRVCFNTGEAYLMNCLNNTQINSYVLLKLIVKNVLNPISKELTSYIVKNILLWLAETNPK
ncbi:hypothetical protein DPMN_046328 [Dreissena polymorpha]|uniref:Mab-21-like nucleotidyltransferase domain-containing protein n=1 Tax=Dreissena polymorpha TaxID=45954 RepID=A0A9D4I0I2_DREPO|nr:hypothetical protein DPMN_046328 [Dreissena polymorpha]